MDKQIKPYKFGNVKPKVSTYQRVLAKKRKKLTIYDLGRSNKVACVGFGIFGGAISNIFAKNGCKVVGRMRNQNDVDEVNNGRTFNCKLKDSDRKYFEENGIRKKDKDGKIIKDFKFNSSISVTTNICDTLKDADVVVLSPKTSVYEMVIKDIKEAERKGVNFKHKFLILSKGVNEDKDGNIIFLSDLLKQNFPDSKIAVMGGANFAKVVLAGKEKVRTTIACNDKDFLQELEADLNLKGEENRDMFKVQRFGDIKAVQVCGIVKNVSAIICGIAKGIKVDSVVFDKLYSKAEDELKTLCEKLDLDVKVVNTCAGKDDMKECCYTGNSRNFKFGNEIGSGEHKENIVSFFKKNGVDYIEDFIKKNKNDIKKCEKEKQKIKKYFDDRVKESDKLFSKDIVDYYKLTNQTVEGLSNVNHLLKLSSGESIFAKVLIDIISNNYSIDKLKEIIENIVSEKDLQLKNNKKNNIVECIFEMNKNKKKIEICTNK